MLDAIVKLSQRRQPRISLVGLVEEEEADVVMIDVADAGVMSWADKQSWLARKVVIWVDAVEAGSGLIVNRPIQWPTLPMLLVRALEQVSAKAAGEPDGVAGCSQVLVVDDSFAMRAHLRGLLEQRGLDVVEAESAEAALQAAATENFCCVLMDVLMPGMDGYEACRRIKEKNKKQNVVMLTSRTSPFDRIRGKMSGSDAYLTKPVDPALLHEVVSRFVAMPAQRGMALPQYL